MSAILVAVLWLWLTCRFVRRMFRRALWEAFPNGVPGPLEDPWIIIVFPLWFVWAAHDAAVRLWAVILAGVAVLFYWGNKESTLDAHVSPKSMLVVAAIAYLILAWIFTMLFHGCDAVAEATGRALDRAELKRRRRAEQERARAAAEAARKERERLAALERERREAQKTAERKQREEREAIEAARRRALAHAEAEERRRAGERAERAKRLGAGVASLAGEVRKASGDAPASLLARVRQLQAELAGVEAPEISLDDAEAAYRGFWLEWGSLQTRRRREQHIAQLHPSAASYLAAVERTWASAEDPREVIDGWFGLDLHGYSVKRALDVVRLAAAEAAAHGMTTLAILHGSSSHDIRDALRSRIAARQLDPVVRARDGMNDAVTWVSLSTNEASSAHTHPVTLPERDRNSDYRRRQHSELTDLATPWAA